MHLRADADLQRRLAVIEDAAVFSATASDYAAECGISLDPATIGDALRLGRDRIDDPSVTARNWPCTGWLPVAVIPENGGWAVEWLHFGGVPLTAPFYEDSIRMARRRPFNRLVPWHTRLSRLGSCRPPLARPDGFVFHMSRCGSTLVAQMLAAMAGAWVVSEPPPVDTVIRIDLPQAVCVAALQAMIGALGRDTAPGGRYFIKLDSWNTAALPLFRAAFPETPWVFLYRDPAHVIASHMRMRGLQTVPGGIGGWSLPSGCPPRSRSRPRWRRSSRRCWMAT